MFISEHTLTYNLQKRQTFNPRRGRQWSTFRHVPLYIIQCTHTFNHLCYMSHAKGGEPIDILGTIADSLYFARLCNRTGDPLRTRGAVVLATTRPSNEAVTYNFLTKYGATKAAKCRVLCNSDARILSLAKLMSRIR
ncbi:hypothetical protein SFRURICE_001392 [Spodoptera frugiperda]|nr:hypothetical protein SFRURICE_001392 [Spodoptera frugiperda]